MTYEKAVQVKTIHTQREEHLMIWLLEVIQLDTIPSLLSRISL